MKPDSGFVFGSVKEKIPMIRWNSLSCIVIRSRLLSGEKLAVEIYSLKY